MIDMFGDDVRFSDEDKDSVTVSTVANLKAIEQFAHNFAPDVVVLEPESLREKVKNRLRYAAEIYN